MRSPLSFVSTAFLVSSALHSLAAVSANPVYYRRNSDGYNCTECPGAAENPFADRVGFVNPAYAKELDETIKSFLNAYDQSDAERTKTVQNTSTFIWVSSTNEVQNFSDRIEEAKKVQEEKHEKLIVPFVIYNLPNRDCAAGTTSGEFSVGYDSMDKYKKFVDSIVDLVTDCTGLDFAVIIEPHALANLVTNRNITRCKEAEDTYIEGIAFAIQRLQLANVAIYLDAAHSGWLGWPKNLKPAVEVFKKVLEKAGKGVKVRGFSTNVANYNPYDPPLVDPAIYRPGSFNPNWSELRYIKALAPYLRECGLPTHFIVDQGRSGAQGIRDSPTHWCNVKGAGFGTRPTTKTGDCLVDAIVWVKPGGESDGTSDSYSPHFAADCAGSSALTPGPESGKWFNEYAIDLVKNAHPPLEISG